MPRTRHNIQAGQPAGQGSLPATTSWVQRIDDAGIRLDGGRPIRTAPAPDVAVGANESGHDDLVRTVLNQCIFGNLNGFTHGKNFAVLHQQGAPLNLGTFNRNDVGVGESHRLTSQRHGKQKQQ